MTKIILVCNGGLSTAMMAKKINDIGEGEYFAEAFGDGEFMEHLEGCDIVLVGPQIRHQIPRIKTYVTEEIPVESINPRYYGLMNAKGVLEDIKKILNK